MSLVYIASKYSRLTFASSAVAGVDIRIDFRAVSEWPISPFVYFLFISPCLDCLVHLKYCISAFLKCRNWFRFYTIHTFSLSDKRTSEFKIWNTFELPTKRSADMLDDGAKAKHIAARPKPSFCQFWQNNFKDLN